MINKEELRKIQKWVDDRFGVPNTVNTQAFIDFYNDFTLLSKEETIRADMVKRILKSIRVSGTCSRCINLPTIKLYINEALKSNSKGE